MLFNNVLIDAVREFHNDLFNTNEKYRKYMSATTTDNEEGSVGTDEHEAIRVLRDAAKEKNETLVIELKLGDFNMADLATLLHKVIEIDGLGGSIPDGMLHLAIVGEENAQAEYRSAQAGRAFQGFPPLSDIEEE